MRNVRYEAAGGVVVHEGRVLVLHRPSRSEVRLPKGHVDPGETPEEAAVREVIEESGYADLEVVADLGHQYVEFERESYRGRVRILRDERYFLMRLTSERQVPRYFDDLAFHPDWIAWDDVLDTLTFEPEREWVRRARVVVDAG